MKLLITIFRIPFKILRRLWAYYIRSQLGSMGEGSYIYPGVVISYPEHVL